MARNNSLVRRRRYDQWPRELDSWQMMFDGREVFADAANPRYGVERRMQSWRRPI